MLKTDLLWKRIQKLESDIKRTKILLELSTPTTVGPLKLKLKTLEEELEQVSRQYYRVPPICN